MTEAIGVLLVAAAIFPVVATGVILAIDAVQNSRRNGGMATATSENDYGVCMFCGRKGFEDQEDLENHIESHPGVVRRD